LKNLFLFFWKIPRKIALFFIFLWQKTLSPDHGPLQKFTNQKCIFYPSCSEYGKECFTKYGFIKGFVKTAWRVLRCNPWNKGGCDPVEKNQKK